TIDLGFQAPGCKLTRAMPHKKAVAASSVACMHHEGREVIDATPGPSPAPDCRRPASVGAPPPGAHAPAGTPGAESWKLPSRRLSRPVSHHTRGPARVHGARSRLLCSPPGGRCCPSRRLWMMGIRGARLDRPALDRLRAAARRGAFDAGVIVSPDRL